MDMLSITIIGLGLAMDAFAVSVVSGSLIKKLKIRHALKIAFYFGGFQALMPVIGWTAGLTIQDLISCIDHWIAFGLLVFVGSKMIFESFQIDTNRKKKNPLNPANLIIFSIATSIDALAVGLTFGFLNVVIWIPVIIIGVITFGLSFLGVFIGTRFGNLFKKKIEFAGGVILIGIGIKIVIEHLVV